MGLVRWLKNIGSGTLYFPGCLTKTLLKEEFENYKKIFNRLDIEFSLLSDEEVCCGLVALNAGYRKDARKLAKKNFEIFRKNKISKIITNCPSCYKMFKEVYPSLVIGWDIEVEYAIVSILRGLKKEGINLEGNSNNVEVVVYNDSCLLSEQFNFYEEAREVINRLGGKIIEMKKNRDHTVCCGASGGIINNFPEIAKKAAKRRIEDSPSKENRIVSISGLCHYNLKSVSDKSIEISTLILERLLSIPK
jgi:Fe-S oxidoreductase